MRPFRYLLSASARAFAQVLGLSAARPSLRKDMRARLERQAERMRRRAHAEQREHALQIETLRGELRRDPVTRLPNRRSLLDALQQQPPAPQPHAPARAGGHLMLFRLGGLAELNHRMPRQHTDQWLRAMAQRIQAVLEREGDAPAPLLARLNGSDFAVLMPPGPHGRARHVAEQVRRELLSIDAAMQEQGRACRWALALSPCLPGQPAATLARLDHALMRAESEASDRIVEPDEPPAETGAGESAWRDILVTALDQHRFSLAVDPPAGGDGAAPWHRGTPMLHQPGRGRPVAAADFMPAAVRLGLSAECDIQAARLALDWLMPRRGDRLAVGLSWSSLGQEDFLPRLVRLLRDRPQQARRLLLETHALSLIEQRADLLALARAVAETGAGLGLAGLGRQLGAVAHLHELPLAYVRLGGALPGASADSPGGRELLAAVARTAQSLGIPVYDCEAADAAATVPTSPPAPTAAPTASPVPETASTLPAALPTELPELPEVPDIPDAPKAARTRRASSAPPARPDPLDELDAAQLRDLLQAQRQAMALLAHELRGPLATLSAAAQSLEFALAGSGEDVDLRLARMRRSVARVDELAEQFMRREHLAARMLQPLREPVDLAQLARELVQAMQPDAAHRLVVAPQAQATGWCDRALCAEVLRNLIQNAIKYSPADQPVEIDAGSGPAGSVWISVADRGPGIGQAERERVFQPSYRGAAHRETRGTGQGLYLARQLCERQGGTLEVDGAPGQGARFTMRVAEAYAAKT